jgi:16S rRNA (cytosine1402-N4)-methyltransferase
MDKKNHTPVMINEVLDCLEPRSGDVFLDATFGAGGYTKAILDSVDCNVIGSDRDENVLEFANKIKSDYGNRFNFYTLKFSEVGNVIDNGSLDGLVLDLGVSSMQLDNADRGFSFNKDSALRMTMGRNDITALDIINSYGEKNIADIIYNYGEEVKSRTIAKKIVEYRRKKKIETTVELANIVRGCFTSKKSNIDSATKTFQALRIFVNDELNELITILNDSIRMLKSGGRLVVVSFHSLEDRIVKDFLIKYGDMKTNKINKYKEEKKETIFRVITKRPLVASANEVEINRRSRSAKLRSAIKC